MRVTVFDYGAGNLHSLAKALAACGASVAFETDPARAVRDTDALVLPGVGAFATAAERIAPARETMRDALRAGLPCLGICLGMQLLFAASEEGPGEGLGLLPGRVTRLDARRVPHIGWNAIELGPAAGSAISTGAARPDVPRAGDSLFSRAPIALGYFANGYACRAERESDVIAWTEHEGDRFPAAVRRGHIVGVQFHPEKSSRAGVAFLAAWLAEAGAAGTAATSSPAAAAIAATAQPGVAPAAGLTATPAHTAEEA